MDEHSRFKLSSFLLFAVTRRFLSDEMARCLSFSSLLQRVSHHGFSSRPSSSVWEVFLFECTALKRVRIIRTMGITDSFEAMLLCSQVNIAARPFSPFDAGKCCPSFRVQRPTVSKRLWQKVGRRERETLEALEGGQSVSQL